MRSAAAATAQGVVCDKKNTATATTTNDNKKNKNNTRNPPFNPPRAPAA
jgi:hypothetical protein